MFLFGQPTAHSCYRFTFFQSSFCPIFFKYTGPGNKACTYYLVKLVPARYGRAGQMYPTTHKPYFRALSPSADSTTSCCVRNELPLHDFACFASVPNSTRTRKMREIYALHASCSRVLPKSVGFFALQGWQRFQSCTLVW